MTERNAELMKLLRWITYDYQHNMVDRDDIHDKLDDILDTIEQNTPEKEGRFKGEVGFFHPAKHYGFIDCPEKPSRAIFFLPSNPNVSKGDKVTFEIEEGTKVDEAKDIKVIENG